MALYGSRLQDPGGYTYRPGQVVLRLLGAGETADRDVRACQHFLSEGVWDDAAVLRVHWGLVAQSLGEADGVLTVDGSDIPKQGTHSAGVARQWCGALGKKGKRA